MESVIRTLAPERILRPDFIRRLSGAEDETLTDCSPDLAELFVASVAALNPAPLVWVMAENENFRKRGEKLRAWLDLFGAFDRPVCRHLRPFEDPFVNREINPSAIEDKAELAAEIGRGSAPVVITTLSGLSVKLEATQELKSMALELGLGARIPRQELVEKLGAMGFVARDEVSAPGQLARRGNIVDLFAPGGRSPIRLEFEGSAIASLRLFDPETQKSISRIESAHISPAGYFAEYENLDAYLEAGGRRLTHLHDILENPRILTLDRARLEEEHEKLIDHFRRIHDAVNPQGKGEAVVSMCSFSLAGLPLLDLSPMSGNRPEMAEIRPLRHSLVEMDREAIDTLRLKISREKLELVVGSALDSVRERLDFLGGAYRFLHRNLPMGVENPHTGVQWLPYRPWIPERSSLPSSPVMDRERLLREIKSGDLVTHRDHGIGRFRGVKQLTVSGFDRIHGKATTTEFITVEYRDGEFLYVPVYEVDSLSSYSALEGHEPELDRMGGRSWRAKQNRARRSIVPFARELLELYARRQATRGTAYEGDSELEDLLHRRFRFVETRDQKRAIREVIHDLEAPVPMDRLVCGDVSFGKTEVAVRAAFRVILNRKQVALLCPTTILASQHFQTFSRRFKDLPVRLALISRMVSLPERRRMAEKVKSGKVDMVIGTHALLSRHLEFQRLGMLIIDEEQRFGVFQKEKIKQNHPAVDVLTLSATPIPRTLSFSMAGLQDISVIRTPPLGRLAIRNHVGPFRPEVLISAVLGEVERGGQVYIVYNDIDGIESFRGKLNAWLPEVDVAVIHARMRSEVIEKTLLAFVNRKTQVLLSTTIIENGIDIPAVNTLVVMKAERFGLTQLYQLRGRIGRSDRRAYAYFMVSTSLLSDKARARLDAIRDFTELGAGYRLAEFDLRLRGAGSLLGNRQHGHIEALGFDYYMELLQRTIQDLKGTAGTGPAADIHVHFPYAVDPEYIPKMEERVGVYRRVMEARDPQELEGVFSEVEDRYGRLPDGMRSVFRVAALRLLVKGINVRSAGIYRDRVVLTFATPPEELPAGLEGFDTRHLSPTEVEIRSSTYRELVSRG